MEKTRQIEAAKQHILAGEIAEAENVCHAILNKYPGDILGNFVLSSVYLISHRYTESETLLNRILEIDPSNAEVLYYLGDIALGYHQNKLAASVFFRRAISSNPNHEQALLQLGNISLANKETEAASEYYHRALSRNPKLVDASVNLGSIYYYKGDSKQARYFFEQALQYEPQHELAFINLAMLYSIENDRQKMYEIALRGMSFENAGALIVVVYSIAKKMCLWDLVDKYRVLVVDLLLSGQKSLYFEMLSLDLLGDEHISNSTLFSVHSRAGELIDKERTAAQFTDYSHATAPSEKLRIGYLSPDFRAHVSNNFVRHLVNDYDRQRFEVYCYSSCSTEQQDATTRQYQQSVDAFFDVFGKTDYEVAQRIHDDGIHILIEMGGYTLNGRIRVLSYHPAPVQISYLGYPYTTGVAEIDYLVSDPYLDGPENARYCVEKPLRLPQSFITFDTLNSQSIEPNIPFKRNGYVTFGSLSAIYKLNPSVVRVWGRVLDAVPGSRLVLNHFNYSFEETRKRVLDEFAKYHIDAERIHFIWEKHSVDHLHYYNDIDIALDTFPLTGGTTTIESLWMGVPMVTLVGETHAQRLSYSVINNVGVPMEDLIAFSEEQFVHNATCLANDPVHIDELHKKLPREIRKSILCDPGTFTHQMENAYITAWNMRFPQHQVKIESDDLSALFVPIQGGVEIAVSGSLNSQDSYVLREHHGWFDPEYDFVLNLIGTGMKVVDIGAGIGAYSLPIAKKIDNGGKLWFSVRSRSERRYLELSLQHNKLDNTESLLYGNGRLQLGHEQYGAQFVRIAVNTTDDWVVSSNADFFEKNSPLVMMSVRRNSSEVDTTLVNLLTHYGYSAYRLVPGLGVLEPFVSPDQLDAMALNLFCCKEDRAEKLETQGKLLRRVYPLSDLPGLGVRAWQDHLALQPYASNQVVSWEESMSRYTDWERYWVALNLFAHAKDPRRSARERSSSLTGSYSIMVMLANKGAVTLPRLFTLVRILTEIGKREVAVTVLNQICATMAKGAFELDEPFLALSEEHACMNPGDRMWDWALSSALEQREKLKEFSSFFSGQASLEILDIVRGLGFQTVELQRRIDLIRSRFGTE